MSVRTLLLSLHLTAIASWLGADVLQHSMRHRWKQETSEVTESWARMLFWLHDRYHAVVAGFILFTGIPPEVACGGMSFRNPDTRRGNELSEH